MIFKFIFKFFYKRFKLLLSQFFSYRHLKNENSKVSEFRIFPSRKLYYKLNFNNGISCRGVSFQNIKPDPLGDSLSVLKKGLSEKNKVEFKTTLKKAFLKEKEEKFGYFFKSIGIFKEINYPLWSQVWPWEEISPWRKFEVYPNLYSLNRKEQLKDLNDVDFIVDIEKFPFSDIAINLHVNQFLNLYKNFINNSLSKNTFKHKSLPDFFLLIDGDSWKWMSGYDGNHRLYILNMINYPSVTSSLSKIIKKDEVNQWPNVKNGVYTKNEALRIFEALFQGGSNLAGLI